MVWLYYVIWYSLYTPCLATNKEKRWRDVAKAYTDQTIPSSWDCNTIAYDNCISSCNAFDIRGLLPRDLRQICSWCRIYHPFWPKTWRTCCCVVASGTQVMLFLNNTNVQWSRPARDLRMLELYFERLIGFLTSSHAYLLIRLYLFFPVCHTCGTPNVKLVVRVHSQISLIQLVVNRALIVTATNIMTNELISDTLTYRVTCSTRYNTVRTSTSTWRYYQV